MTDLTPERQLQLAEDIALGSAALVTILTFVYVGFGAGVETNPIADTIISSLGWYAFAAVRLSAVGLAFAIARRVYTQTGSRTALWFGIAWSAGMTLNLIHDLSWAVFGGIPDGMPFVETVLFAGIVALFASSWSGRSPSGLIPSRRPNSRQLRAIAFTAILVVSIIPAGAVADTSHSATVTETPTQQWTPQTSEDSGGESANFNTNLAAATSDSYRTDFTEYATGSAPSDWTVEYGSIPVKSDQSKFGDRSLYADASGGSGGGHPSSHPTSNYSTANASVWINDTGGTGESTLRMGDGQREISVGIHDGNLEYYSGSWNTISTTPNSSEWVLVEVHNIDAANDQYDVYWQTSTDSGAARDLAMDGSITSDGYNKTAVFSSNSAYFDGYATHGADRYTEGQTVSGQVTADDGTPIENATVRVTGVDYNNIEPSGSQTLDERAEELYQEAQDPLPDAFDAGANIDSNVRNADGEYVLVNTYEECGDVDLQPQSPVVEPGGNPVCVSVWDASDEPGLLQGDDLTNQYPGQPVEGEVTFERLSPTGEVTDTYTFTTGGSRELNILGGTVMRDHEESVAMQNVAPGIYRISLEGSSHTQVRSIGDPQDLAQTMEDDLEDEAGQLTQRAQDIRENFNQSKFTSTEVTTNETGHYSAEVGTSVNMVAVEAYHTGGVNISSIDPTNFGLPSDAHPLTVARAWQDQSSYNGSIYLPSRPQEYEAPTSNADITLQEVSYTPHGNNSELNDRIDQLEQQLRNQAQRGVNYIQQNAPSQETLTDTYETLNEVAQNNDDTYARAEELLRQAEGENASLNITASEASDAELRARITVLEQALSEQRNSIPSSTSSSTSTENVSAVAQFGGELTEDEVDVIAHYSNGTSQPVNDSYISIDQTVATAVPGQGSAEVTVSNYPLGDATSVQFEWIAARDGGTATVRERVRNPTINADAPQVDSVRVSSLAPGPNERVTVELNPGDNSDFRELTSATVYAPDGTEVTTTAIENGQETSFETSGQGTYTAQLTYTDVNGNNYTRTIRVQADDIDRNRPASVRAESGPTGVFALVGDGLTDGGVTVEENGDMSIVAGIPGDDEEGETEVPSELHVYTGDVAANPSGDISVRVVQGPDDEAVSERSRVLIHGQATPEDGTFVYRDGRPVTTDGNQYGQVTHQSNQTLIETYTDESGEVTVSVAQPQGVVSSTVEWAEWNAKRIEVFGYSPLSLLTGGASGLGLLGLGLFARRRRGDIK